MTREPVRDPPFTHDHSKDSQGGDKLSPKSISTVLSRSKERPTFDVEHPDYGAEGDGQTDDSAAIQAAIDAAGNAGGGIVLLPSPEYRIESELSSAPNVSIQGTGTVLTTNLDIRHLTVSDPDFSVRGVTFDGENATRTATKWAVRVNNGGHRVKFANCTFRNLRGGEDGNTLPDCYGLYIDLHNVRDFEVVGCRFEEISNRVAGTDTGEFAGGIFLRHEESTAIPDDEVTSGNIDRCRFFDIYNRYPDTFTADDKNLAKDADAIRTFTDRAAETGPFPISIENIHTERVEKRSVKISGTNGVTVRGLFCDGRNQNDPDVEMAHAVKAYGDAHISGVTAKFGNRTADQVVQVDTAENMVISDISVDDCKMVVSDAREGTQLRVDNISSEVNGGLNIDLTDRVTVDGADLSFVRSRFDKVRRGATFNMGTDNGSTLSVSDLTIEGGQFSAAAETVEIDNVTARWDYTGDPTNLVDLNDDLFRIVGKDVSFSNCRLITPDGFENYTDADGAMVRLWGTGSNARIQGSDFYVKGTNNNCFYISRTGSGDFRNLVTDAGDHAALIGEPAQTCDNVTIDGLKMISNSQILLRNTLNNISLRHVSQIPTTNSIIVKGDNESLTNVELDGLRWHPDGSFSPSGGYNVSEYRIRDL